MSDYYQYVIRVNGKVKWFFGTSDNIDLSDIVVEKIKGLDIPQDILTKNKESD